VEATAAAAAALANLADKHCGGPASLVTGLAIELAAVRLNPNLFEPLDMVDIVDRPKRLELLVELIVWCELVDAVDLMVSSMLSWRLKSGAGAGPRDLRQRFLAGVLLLRFGSSFDCRGAPM